jgi:hypothetical protein
MKKITVASAALFAAGLLALAGCNRSPEQPAATDNGVVSETNVTTESNVAAPVAKPPSVPANASEAVVRPEPSAPDSQTQDDADATGMTARVHRDDTPANETTAP